MPSHWTDEDKARLRPRNRETLEIMLGAGWMTLVRVAALMGLRNPSTVASRLRDLKATGAWDYEMRRTGSAGLNEYRLFIVAKDDSPEQMNLDLREELGRHGMTGLVVCRSDGLGERA